MNFFESLILGIVQGLTEFLPVSSSGHLLLIGYIFGNESSGDENLLFTIFVHLATAIATIYVFKKDVVKLLKEFFKKNESSEKKFIINVLISMLPAMIIGLVFENKISVMFENNLFFVGLMLIITSIFLFYSDKKIDLKKKITYRIALIIGVAQAIAIAPGISRSGITIACALFIGISRKDSARFSFLMVVPLIIGSVFKIIIDYKQTIFESIDPLNLSIGFFGALLSGIFACKLMMRLVQNSKLKYFSIYCFSIGLIAIVLKWI